MILLVFRSKRCFPALQSSQVEMDELRQEETNTPKSSLNEKYPDMVDRRYCVESYW